MNSALWSQLLEFFQKQFLNKEEIGQLATGRAKSWMKEGGL